MKTYRKIDYCLRVIDPVLMTTVECGHAETANVWYHTRDVLVIGKNHVMLTKDKIRDIYYVVGVSRTTDYSDSADAMYITSKPKGGARCHKKKAPIPEDYVPEMVA